MSRRRGPAMASTGASLVPAVVVAISATLLASPAPVAAQGFYGFVSYTTDEAAPLDDAFLVMRAAGAGWAQAEGPLTFTRGAAWGLIQPVSLEEHDWSSLDWVERAAAAGLAVLLNVSSGHDDPGLESYCPWVDCQGAAGVVASTRCPPRSYQEWYQFAYDVARHFDGEHGAPAVRHFMSDGENDDAASYWTASAEAYYGGGETVVIERNDGLGSLELPAAQLPILAQGIRDGNPEAAVVMGCSSAWRGYSWSHLKDLVDSGAGAAAVEAQAREYAIGQPYAGIVDSIANDPEVMRSIDFFDHSLALPQYYDVYAVHFYAPAGYRDAMEYVLGRLEAAGVDRPVWNTGEGALLVGDPASVRLGHAYLHLRRIVESHALGLAWHDVSFLVDVPVFGGGLYGLPSGGLDYPRRNELAGSFAFLSRVLPSRQAASALEVEGPFADTELHAFAVDRGWPGSSGFLAAGWCRDECPANVFAWCNPDCPKMADLAELLDVDADQARAWLDFRGRLTSAECSGEVLKAEFAEAPFFVAWGADTDRDCVPDVVDNCPLVPNPDQASSEVESVVGLGNPAILAPDFLGDACDPRPLASDPPGDRLPAPRAPAGRVAP